MEAANMVCDLLQKIELLHAAGTEMNPPHGQEIVRTFYDILTILDTKGLALLAFDGIVVAATTFAAERGGVFHNRGWPRFSDPNHHLISGCSRLMPWSLRDFLFVPRVCRLQHS